MSRALLTKKTKHFLIFRQKSFSQNIFNCILFMHLLILPMIGRNILSLTYQPCANNRQNQLALPLFPRIISVVRIRKTLQIDEFTYSVCHKPLRFIWINFGNGDALFTNKIPPPNRPATIEKIICKNRLILWNTQRKIEVIASSNPLFTN